MSWWDAARVAFLIVGTCLLGWVWGALAATVLEWRDAYRQDQTIDKRPGGTRTRR